MTAINKFDRELRAKVAACFTNFENEHKHDKETSMFDLNDIAWIRNLDRMKRLGPVLEVSNNFKSRGYWLTSGLPGVYIFHPTMFRIKRGLPLSE